MCIIAIWGDQKMLGLRCAQILYGMDLMQEVLQGYAYQGRNGRLLVRVREGETTEDDICDECERPLYICNASEVTV